MKLKSERKKIIFGQTIRELRHKHGMTLAKLAKEADITQAMRRMLNEENVIFRY